MDPSAQRMWHFYFCYCEGGFHERVIASTQVMFAKPMNRREPLLHRFEEMDRTKSA